MNKFESGCLVLASASPRRRMLLEGAGLAPQIKSVDIDETPRTGEDAQDYVRRMAESKARVGAERAEDDDGLILAGDTVVVLDDRILPKPVSPENAAAMLADLSGQTHTVLSGWASVDRGGQLHSGIEEARIRFRELTNR